MALKEVFLTLMILHHFSSSLGQFFIQAKHEGRLLNYNCMLAPVNGQCNRGHQRWYYDPKTLNCKQFKYGGCGGNGNRFFSWGQCVLQCPYEKTTNLACLQPKVVGPCHSSIQRFYYNVIQERCEPFYFGGCLGNDNRFKTRKECESNCPARQGCLERKKRGPCGGNVPRYYFNKATRQCEQFIFGGCQPNGNNFLTKDQCEQECPIEVRKRTILHDQIVYK